MCPSIWTSKPFLDLSIVDIENEISLYFENIELNYKKNIEKKIVPKKKIKALKDELERITNVYTKGRTTEKNYDLEYERIEKEIKDLEQYSKPKENTVLIELLKTDWKPMYETLNKENKRIFWRSLINKIDIDAKNYKKGREYIKITFM